MGGPEARVQWAVPAILFFVLAMTGVGPAYAQQPPGKTGVGVQFGKPGGVSVKLYRKPGFAYEGLAAWNLSDFFFLSGHALHERTIPDSPLGYYLGPGAVAGIQKKDSQSDLVVGVSGTFGVHFLRSAMKCFYRSTLDSTCSPVQQAISEAGSECVTISENHRCYPAIAFPG